MVFISLINNNIALPLISPSMKTSPTFYDLLVLSKYLPLHPLGFFLLMYHLVFIQ